MRDVIALLCAGLLAAVAVAAADEPAPSMLGFDARDAAAQAKLESRFDAQLDPGELRDWLKRLSAEPNQVGSRHDKENAEWLLAKFREWGWDAHLETFYALYPTPKSETLELVAPTAYRAALHEPALPEPALPEDRSSGAAGQLPPYNVYGGDGDVTAELVYVNYGMPDDYQELERLGISVKGRIVLARYGGGWRGLKPDLAEQHGAVGCIIYSDPRDDGYWQGDVWPQGGWRPPFGVQRGSVERMQEYPGDPLTPGVPATQDAQRLPLDRARVLLHIPVLPISAQDAQPLLAALGGPVAPEAWRGALPLTYHVGAGPAKVHLAVSSDWTLKPVYDVIARIAGRSQPDQWVIRGNHHDAWVFGAWDPLAGTVALMAEAKAIGKLVKSGWRPARTLIYASWDAEEPGLIGSTEWVEAHAPELAEHAVLYVNSDTNARGFLQAGGSHALQVLVNQVAAGVRDPETGVPVRERLRAKLEVDGFDAHADAEKKELARRAQAGGDLPIAALGSGSDYSAFLQNQGIATLSLEYGGEDADAGIYHSAYDSFDHYVRFGDPQFAYGIALAQTVGRTVLRMADAPVLPLQFGGFAETVADYVRQLHQLADDKRSRTETLRQLLETRAFTLAADPLNPLRPPAQEDEVPYLDFAPLDNAVVRLKRSAQAYDAVAANALALSEARRAALDRLLAGQEHRLMDARGLPGRSWFQHMIYAPGLYTGYGVKTLPGVREAIEQRQWDVAQRYAVIVAQRLDDYRAGLDQAVAILKGQD